MKDSSAMDPLDAADRNGWIDVVLTTSGLPLHPPQIHVFPASP
jgi:hypothetical protein